MHIKQDISQKLLLVTWCRPVKVWHASRAALAAAASQAAGRGPKRVLAKRAAGFIFSLICGSPQVKSATPSVRSNDMSNQLKTTFLL
ncbi:MAG: hypothetical protein PVI27_06540, partial [Desulfobacteraceae bacterium]